MNKLLRIFGPYDDGIIILGFIFLTLIFQVVVSSKNIIDMRGF
jgi:hypothetical protein